MFTVRVVDTNYCEVPVGQIFEDFDNFVAVWDLTVINRDALTAEVEADWGNGEGADHFEVRFS